MKLMIASDIHGSGYFCEKLMDRYKEEKPDRLVLLGDILYHGPRNDLPGGHSPKRVAELLNEISDKIVCVRGNCEAEVDQLMLKFPCLSDYLLIIDSNAECRSGRKGRTVFVTHGHLYNIDEPPCLFEGDIFFSGHTHIPAFDKRAGVVFANPGSVSIPKACSENSYMILEGNTLVWKNIDGIEYRQEEL